MAEQRWIPRHGFAWLLAAQLAVIAPHISRLPVWVVLAWVLSAAWRTMIFRGRWTFPGAVVKLGLFAVCVAGIRQRYGNWTGLEPAVALLISAFSFKLLEANSRRDAYLLLFLGYFVALTEFLFEQGLGTTLYMLLCVWLLTTALLTLHQPQPLRFSWQPLRKTAVMLGQALPLMALLFLVFPRLAPLWQVPMPGAGGRTGMSDVMTPGNIARLSKSDALAFRVQFTGPRPPHAQWYWRGLVMDDFDGRSWHVGEYSDVPMSAVHPRWHDAGPAGQPHVDYRVYLEPTDHRWLYALAVPQPRSNDVALTWDYRLLADSPVHEKFAYRVRSWPQRAMDRTLDPRLRARTLQLPAGSNPQTRQWARALRAAAGSPGQFADRVLAYFRDQPFYYTLNPPLLGKQSIDEFLFHTRRGFCEHYASSFAFAMRAGGVPARVVAGYQGGEINPLTGAILVHQYDAHAWVEIWLRDQGWVRIDPTAAVAPLRIERGLESAIGDTAFLADSSFTQVAYHRVAWLNTLRLQLDRMNYRWTRWVVNYRDDTQAGVLQSLLGGVSPWRLALLLVGGGALVLAVVMFFLLGAPTREKVAPELRLYRRFLRRMARRGYACPPGMSPASYARWLQGQKPHWREVQTIADCFTALSYSPLDAGRRRELLRRLRRAVWRIDRSMLRR